MVYSTNVLDIVQPAISFVETNVFRYNINFHIKRLDRKIRSDSRHKICYIYDIIDLYGIIEQSQQIS